MNDFYVYAWRRPDTGALFYVGKGRMARDAQLKDHNQIFMRIVRKLERHGLRPSVERLHENLTEEQAFSIERQLIAESGRINLNTGTLANLTDGGEGSSGTVVGEATRLKVGKASRSRWADDSYRNRLSQVQRERYENQELREQSALHTTLQWQDNVTRERRTISIRATRQTATSRQRTSVVSKLSPPTAANKSGFKGVFFSKAASKWTCQIKLEGKPKHLGLFPTPEEAALAYDRAAYAAWGSDCYLNFPDKIAA